MMDDADAFSQLSARNGVHLCIELLGAVHRADRLDQPLHVSWEAPDGTGASTVLVDFLTERVRVITTNYSLVASQPGLETM